MGILYNLIFIVFSFFYIPFFLLKKRRREGIGLRLGLYPHKLIERLNRRKNIWVHAVSVGEVIAASCFITRLRSRYPEYRLIITTVTETGNSVAKELAREDEIVLYLPFDITFCVKRALSYIRPASLIIMETELWPTLIRQAYSDKIPIVLVNGRISEKSFKGYILVKYLLCSTLKKISLLLMQTKTDKERAIFLGADVDKVKVSGNMKFDSAVSFNISRQEKEQMRSSLGLKEEEKLFCAGSTHPGEEKIILSAYANIKKRFRDLRLLIAPRHIERAPEIEKVIAESGFTPMRTSRLPVSTTDDKVFLLDTIGHLKNFYSIAEVVFIGGSLVKKGGQNMIEPAVFAKPILFGPYTFNFRDIVSIFLKEEAAMLIEDIESLERTISLLLEDPALCRSVGERAKRVVDENIGASDRTIDAINETLQMTFNVRCKLRGKKRDDEGN